MRHTEESVPLDPRAISSPAVSASLPCADSIAATGVG
jgi:hypothetical protein